MESFAAGNLAPVNPADQQQQAVEGSSGSRRSSAQPDDDHGSKRTINRSCAYCKSSKMKCHRDDGDGLDEPCRRCKAAGIECVVLERKQRGKQDPSDPGDRPTKRRRSTSAASLLPASSSVSASTTAHPPPQPSTSRVQVSLTTKSPPSTRRGWPDKSSAPRNGDFVALSPNAPLVSPLDLLNTSTGHGHAVSPLGSSSALSEAASPASAVFTDPPSLSSQHDPLLLGVLSEQRARELHLLYWTHLQPLSTILDPMLDTFESTRIRSSLLFTAICTSAARFRPDSAALSTRLDSHFEQLVGEAVMRSPASLELVQALFTVTPWLPPSKGELCDVSSRFLALSISSYRELLASERRHGFEPSPRLLRMRERVLLVMYQYDSGLAILSGGSSSLGADVSVLDMPVWAAQPDCIPSDWTVASLNSLRRAMSRSPVTSSSVTAGSEALGPSLTKAMLDDLFARFESSWLRQHNLAGNAYVELVRHHSELSLLSFAAAHCEGDAHVLLVASVQAAIRVCQCTISMGHSGRFLPNNTIVMIVYAALILFKLNQGWPTNIDIIQLLQDVTKQLLYWANVTPHRNSRTAVYASQLARTLDSTTLLFPPTPVSQPAAQSLFVSSTLFQYPVEEYSPGYRGPPLRPVHSQAETGILTQAGLSTELGLGLDELFNLLPTDEDLWDPSWLTAGQSFASGSL